MVKFARVRQVVSIEAIQRMGRPTSGAPGSQPTSEAPGSMEPGERFCLFISRLAQRGKELVNDKELQEAIHFLNQLGRVEELRAEDLDAVVVVFRAEGQDGQSTVMQAILSGLRTSTIIKTLVGGRLQEAAVRRGG